MRRIKSPILLLFILVAPTVVAAASGTQAVSPDARVWLDRMGEALRALNYEGTFVYLHDGRMETMQVTHRADSKGGMERLVALNGVAREIVRDHNQVTCILPDSHSVLVEKRASANPFPGPLVGAKDTDALAAHYNFRTLGEGRVAGHDCQIIAVEPRDAYRYGYRLWLDKDTALPVRSDLLDQSGRVIEQVMFTRLSFPERIPDDALKAKNTAAGYVWKIQGAAATQETNGPATRIHVGSLPPGFQLTLNELQHIAGASALVRHMIFTDGLASVSVFAGPAKTHHRQLKGYSRIGAVNAYGEVMNGHHITVVGEVPARTVRLIGESVEFESDPSTRVAP